MDRRPPYTQFGGLNTHSSALEHNIISYSVTKEETKSRKFIGSTYLKLNGSLGAGISFNRSKYYYDSIYNSYSYSRVYSNGSYFGYDYTIKKKGIGLFFLPKIGLTLFNKKLKRFLTAELFYYKGLKNMIEFDLDYYYGNFNNASRIDRNQIVRNRGSHFGLKIGVPLRIIK